MNHLINEFLDTIVVDTTDGWETSKFNAWQKQGNKAKGTTGENYIKYFLDTQGYLNVVKVGGCRDHDLKSDSQNIEVKTSFAMKNDGKIIHDSWKFQHIGFHKDWEYIVFIGINPPLSMGRVRRGWRDNPKDFNVAWFTREQLENFRNEELLTPQQGGKKGENDDWWTTGSFFKDINYGVGYENIPC